jgi:ParB-like chromosome segregation protein Spo0J
MDRFKRREDLSYSGRTQLTSKLCPLATIEPPHMGQRLRGGHGGFERDRMIDVLRDIALRKEIWPIEVIEAASGDYRYRLHHGAHRFHASVAAGFSHIPAIVVVRY